MRLSRRDILRMAPAAVAGTAWAAGIDHTAQYRARATVLVLSVPLLHRDNVGSGYLRVAESEEGGKRRLRLEFGAGSLPERAAGLNRLGVFEETVVTAGEQVESARYFGYMTASNEKDLSQARSALQQGGSNAFTAIRGTIEGRQVSNRLLRLGDLPVAGWAEREKLTEQIRARLADESTSDGHSRMTSRDEPCSPFLYAVNCAMRSSAETCAKSFVHNGAIHRLRTVRKGVDKAGVTEMEGRIENEGGKELSAFRLWYEGAHVERGPLRFEFRPRSFLRLTFERV